MPKESCGSSGSIGGGSSNGAPSPGLHVGGHESMSPGSPPPLQLTPTLGDVQINRLAEAAKSLATALPTYEPKPQNSKKRICKDLEVSELITEVYFFFILCLLKIGTPLKQDFSSKLSYL